MERNPDVNRQLDAEMESSEEKHRHGADGPGEPREKQEDRPTHFQCQCAIGQNLAQPRIIPEQEPETARVFLDVGEHPKSIAAHPDVMVMLENPCEDIERSEL